MTRSAIIALHLALVALSSPVQAASPAEFEIINGVTDGKRRGQRAAVLHDDQIKLPARTALIIMADPNKRNASFNGALQQQGATGRIESCDTLVDVHVGTAYGNNSYGGLCVLIDEERKIRVMICDDQMIGRFAFKKVEGDVQMQELVDFVVSNCFGG